jgi:hypothetical protein
VSALSTALSALLPDRPGTLLLQACLAKGDTCGRAWTAFQQEGRELTELFRTDRGELKRLGPLLHDNLRRNGIGTDSRLATVLRTGALREELRTKIYREVLERLLLSLESRAVDSVLLGGAALAEWAYPTPSLRHSHDIDLLVAEPETGPAVSALLAEEFSGAESAEGRDGAVVLTHRNSLPVRLCGSMYELGRPEGSLSEARKWSGEFRVGQATTRVLGPEAALAYALARAAFSPRRSNLQWACDAWMICARAEPLGIDRFLEVLRPSRLLLPASIMLDYLARIGAPIAPQLVEAAKDAAATTSTLERDLALFGLRRGAPGGVIGVMRRVPDAQTRLALLKWLSFPSPEYLRWSSPPGRRTSTPALYLTRAASAIQDLARRRFRAGKAGGPDA